MDEVPAWVSANHQLPVFPQLQRLWPQSTVGHGAPWSHCGAQLDWQGPGPGAWGVENPTGGCHPVSQAVISCSVHNWAVITLWPQMGCRCDYVLLASPCLRLLTACCPWCPLSKAPRQTQGQQPPAQTLEGILSPLLYVLRKSQLSLESDTTGSHWF